VTGQGEAVSAVKNWLDSTASGNWRLIIDNVDDQYSESASIRPLLPIMRDAILFIGARTDDIDHLVEESSRIVVPPWTEEEAAMMLLKLAGLPNEPERRDPEAQVRHKNAVDLASRLGCIPLAIAQAAAYIKKNRISIQSYTNELFSTQTSAEVERSKLLARAVHGPSDLMPQAVMVTWDYSYERLKNHTPAAAKLIQFFSFLSPDGIPLKMLNQSVVHQICDAGPELSLIEELGHLQSFAMIQMTSASEYGGLSSMVITIPALIATWIRDTKIANADRAFMIDIAFRLVAEQFPLANKYTPAAGSHLVSHVRAVQGHRDNIHAEKDTVSRQLDYRMGRHLFFMGQYAEAKDLLMTHFQYLQETESDVREQAICGHYVACSLNALDDEATEGWFDRAIELGKALSNTDEFDAWETLTWKAGHIFKKGSLPKAKELLTEVLDARNASLPDGYDESCIFPLKFIAGVCQRLDENEEALDFYSKALDIAEREYGIRNGQTMKLLFGKVEMLKALEDNGEAEEYLQNYLLKFFDKEFVSKHESSCLSETLEQVFPVLRNLYQYNPHDEIDLKDYIADVYSKEGKHFRALNWYTDAYDQARSCFTDESLHTAFIREHLAMALSKVGDFEAAITHLHAVIKIREDNNADKMEILNAQSAEVFFLLDNGNGTRALELGTKIYEKYKEISDEDWETLNSLTNLANIYQEIGFPSRAMELSQQALEEFEATDSAEDEDTAFLYKVRGLALADLGKYDDALAALKVSIENYESDPYESLLVEIEMARIQSKLGNPHTALKSCQDAHKRINECSDDPAGHPLRWHISHAEAMIYMDLSDPENAMASLHKAENMALAHFSKLHTSISKISLAMARVEMALAEKTQPKRKGSSWQESNDHFQRAHDLYARSAEGFRRSFGGESKYVGDATDGMIISAKHMAELQLQNAQAQGGKIRKAFTYFL
jgi:tetratricopeptide (TPR) repeat protein